MNAVYLSSILILFLIPTACAVSVETFASPDSSFEAISGFLSKANVSIAVATYTLSSMEIADILTEKKDEGLRIEVMVDKSPAGGLHENAEKALCLLQENGIKVLLYDGPLRYMHAKYVIRDGGAVLVTSENLGYAGFPADPDYGNRGWGVIAYDDDTAGRLSGIFEEDKGNSIGFECGLGEFELFPWNPAGAYAPKFEGEAFTGQEVGIVASPGSLEGMLSLMQSANSSILVEQFYVYTHWGSVKHDNVSSAPNPLLEALIDKAREGIDVKLLLDSTYYNMDPEKGTSNFHTIDYVNSLAESENIPIKAKATDLDEKGLLKLHNKGMVIDRKIALVSSINLNENSVMNNREVGLTITGEAAGYYADVFESDWADAGKEYGLGFVPAMISLALLGSIVLIFLISGRRTDPSPLI